MKSTLTELRAKTSASIKQEQIRFFEAKKILPYLIDTKTFLKARFHGEEILFVHDPLFSKYMFANTNAEHCTITTKEPKIQAKFLITTNKTPFFKQFART